MAETRPYGQTDIQRYLQRKMSSQEMHAFEKALMDNPFLVDALEGYAAADATTSEKHLYEIENELGAAKQPAKVVQFKIKQTTWFKIAGIVLVVALAGLLTFGLLSKNKDSQKTSMASTPAPMVIEKHDTVGPTEKPVASIDVLPKKEIYSRRPQPMRQLTLEQSAPLAQTSKPTSSDSLSALSTLHNQEDLLVMNNARSNKAAANEVLPERTGQSQEMQQMNELRRKDLDVMERSLASISSEAKKSSATSPAVNVVADTAITGNIAVQQARLEKKSLSLSEIVAGDLAKKRSASPRLKNSITPFGTEPQGGWRNFEKYVATQVDSLNAINNEKFTKEDIELEFSINQEGRPTDIRVQKGIDTTAVEAAISILSRGPLWHQRKDKKIKVIIGF